MKKRVARGGGNRDSDEVAGVRIVGGSLRGRMLRYSGDIRTRPMKDRTREAVFNLLGPRIVGAHAIDLFAGTGALGIEAVSRGAARATLIERHHPTTKLIVDNAAELGVADKIEAVFGDAFLWGARWKASEDERVTVFCSPPYEFYESRREDMLKVIEGFVLKSPPGSLVVVEADERFDMGQLPRPADWNVRTYAPAIVAIYEQPGS